MLSLVALEECRPCPECRKASLKGSLMDTEQLNQADEGIPSRAEVDSFAGLPDEELWALLEESKRTAMVGLKAPGRRRGTWKGKLLIDEARLKEAEKTVASQRGVTLLSADPLLPFVTVKLDDLEALRNVRRLPVL